LSVNLSPTVNTNNDINNTVVRGNFSVNQSTAATAVTCTLAQTNNTNSGSTANLIISTGGTSSPFITYTVNNSVSWSSGIDPIDSQKYKVSQSTALGTNDCITITPAGLLNRPLQCAFSAYLSTTKANVTGTGTVVGPVIFDTKLFDIGNDYSTSTGKFTAPINGIYHFTVCILYTNLVAGAGYASSAVNVRVNGTAGVPQLSFSDMNPVASANLDFSFEKSYFIQLTAGNTLQVDTNVFGGATNGVAIGGGSLTATASSGAVTYFQVHLIA
jgi:hypothetical protein